MSLLEFLLLAFAIIFVAIFISRLLGIIIRDKSFNRLFYKYWKELKERWRKQFGLGVFFNIVSLIFLIWASSLALVVFRGILISITNPDIYRYETAHTFWPTISNVQERDIVRLGIDRIFKLENYKAALESISFENNTYFNMVWNSIWFSFGATFMKLLSTVCFAYIVSRYRFKGRKFLYTFVLIQMIIPIYGQTTANYKLLDTLGLIDSPLFLLALGAGHGMYFLICHSFFESLPKSYEEAATIDGAGYMRVFLQIMLPLAKPIIISIGLLTFVSCWNDYATTLLYLPTHYTLSSGMYKYQFNKRTNNYQTPVYFAGIFLSALPIATLFLVFNKTLMENMAIGGIKG